jgi:hypothetical protein
MGIIVGLENSAVPLGSDHASIVQKGRRLVTMLNLNAQDA